LSTVTSLSFLHTCTASVRAHPKGLQSPANDTINLFDRHSVHFVVRPMHHSAYPSPLLVERCLYFSSISISLINPQKWCFDFEASQFRTPSSSAKNASFVSLRCFETVIWIDFAIEFQGYVVSQHSVVWRGCIAIHQCHDFCWRDNEVVREHIPFEAIGLIIRCSTVTRTASSDQNAYTHQGSENPQSSEASNNQKAVSVGRWSAFLLMAHPATSRTSASRSSCKMRSARVRDGLNFTAVSTFKVTTHKRSA